MTWTPARERVDAPAVRRERAFDVLRGLCIVSMTFGHLASRSFLERVTHAPGWVDGAVGFVSISGLVLGLVQRRVVDTLGLPRALARVLRRIRVIYVANTAITLSALIVGTYLPAHTPMPSAHHYGWGLSLLRVLIVAVNPAYSVLGLYVFLMFGALGAVILLARRRTGLLLVLSVLVYVGARLADLDTSLPGHGQIVAFHVAGWQLLYVLGLVLGWHWRERQVELLVLDRRVQLPALVLVVALTCLSHLVGHGVVSGSVASRLTAAFDKPTLAPGVLVFAVAILAVGYRMAAWASRWPAARWFAPVATIGRHGLDSYVIATMATIVVPATIRFPQSGWFAQVLAVAVLLAAFLWARLREGGHGRRSGAAPPVGPLVSAQGSLRPVRTSPEDR